MNQSSKRCKVTYILGMSLNQHYVKRIKVAKRNHDVSLITWKMEEHDSSPTMDGVEHYDLYIEANTTDPLSRIKPYGAFLRRAVGCLKKVQPDVIHMQSLDMLFVACLYKTIFAPRVKIVYEVVDIHSLLIDPAIGLKRKVASKVLMFLEAACSSKVDRLIVTSMKYFECYLNKYYKLEDLLFIPNAPYGESFAGYQPKNHEANFTIGFFGGIRYIDQTKMLIEASDRTGVKVRIAGPEDGTEISDMSRTRSHVDYLGPYDFEKQVISMYQSVDLIYSVYDASMNNVRIALPNKLYEAVLCELPIIVAKNTYLQELVEGWGVGVAVGHDDVEDLVEVITRLKDAGADYQKMVDACRAHVFEADANMYFAQYAEALDDLARESRSM